MKGVNEGGVGTSVQSKIEKEIRSYMHGVQIMFKRRDML